MGKADADDARRYLDRHHRAVSTGNLFKAGLRLDIASSDFHHFDVNTNTGEPEGMARRSRIAENTVHLDRAHPSHVLLPRVPTTRDEV